MKSIQPYLINSGELDECFCSRSQHSSKLKPQFGDGEVRSYKLDKGVNVRLWNCSFKRPVRIDFTQSAKEEARFFTLAFFLTSDGVKLATDNTSNSNPSVWNILFFCAHAHHLLNIQSNCRIMCLTISFSSRWISEAVSKEVRDTLIQNKISKSKAVYKACSMNIADRELISRSLNFSLPDETKAMFLKATAYTLVANFIPRLQDEGCQIEQSETIISKLKAYIGRNIHKRSLNLKSFAMESKVSVSTLNRKFTSCCGVTISEFSKCEKMKYARMLIAKNHSIADVARILGYRSVYKFVASYRKFFDVAL